MKKIQKILIVLFVLAMISACNEKKAESKIEVSEVNEEVDETLAKDTIDVLQILDKNINHTNKSNFEEEERIILNDYVEKYAEEKRHREFQTQYEDEPDFTVSDYQIFIRTEILVLASGSGSFVNNPNIDVDINDIVEMIEDGFQKRE